MPVGGGGLRRRCGIDSRTCCNMSTLGVAGRWRHVANGRRGRIKKNAARGGEPRAAGAIKVGHASTNSGCGSLLHARSTWSCPDGCVKRAKNAPVRFRPCAKRRSAFSRRAPRTSLCGNTPRQSAAGASRRTQEGHGPVRHQRDRIPWVWYGSANRLGCAVPCARTVCRNENSPHLTGRKAVGFGLCVIGGKRAAFFESQKVLG